MKTGTANRRLIPIEQSKEMLNRRLGASNILLVSRIRGPLTPELLRRGLDLLQRRHPRLRSTIEGPESELRFRDDHASSIPLRVERFAHEATLHEIELDELNRRIDSSSCLMRATLLLPEDANSSCHLLLLSHHAMADGYSLVELLEDLVGFCGRLCEGETIADGGVQSLKLLPSVQDMMPADMRSLRGRLEGWLYTKRTRARVNSFGARTLPVEESVPPRSRTSGAVKRLLDEERVLRLRQRCEESGASPHAILCAAVLFALARRLASDDPGEIPLLCRSSVSLRKKLEPPAGNKDLGLLASFLFSFHRIRPDTTLETVASEILEQLWLGYRNRDMFHGLQRNLKNTAAAMQGRIPVSVFVTNLDEPRINTEHGPLSIEEIFGLPGGAAFAGILGVASVTLNGRLALGFFFSRPALSHATVEAIADDVVQCIELACDGTVRFEEFLNHA